MLRPTWGSRARDPMTGSSNEGEKQVTGASWGVREILLRVRRPAVSWRAVLYSVSCSVV